MKNTDTEVRFTLTVELSEAEMKALAQQDAFVIDDDPDLRRARAKIRRLAWMTTHPVREGAHRP